MHEADFSPEQIDALANFQAITESYDQEQAMILLQNNNWDVMAAAQDYFASTAVDSRRQSVPREEAKVFYPPTHNLLDEEQPDDNPGVATQLWSGLMGIGSSISNMFSGLLGTSSTSSVSSGAISFVKKLKATYPELVFPEFSTQSLQGVLAQAREIRRPVIFYIHNVGASEHFIREVLCSEVIIDIMSQSYILWGTLNTTDEGRSMMRNLNVKATPTFAACRISSEPDPIVLEVIEGETTLEGLFAFLDNNLMLYNEQTTSISRPSRPVDPVVDHDRLLRQEQERAYREVERQYLEQQRAKQVEEDRARAEQEREQQEAELLNQHKERLMDSIGLEPSPGQDVAEVVIRLPDGSRSIRRFMRNATLRQLIDYISTLDNVPRQHEVVTTYPTMVLQPTDDTVESAGLFPKAIVHVREQLD